MTTADMVCKLSRVIPSIISQTSWNKGNTIHNRFSCTISAGNIEFWGYSHIFDWSPDGSEPDDSWTGANFQKQFDWEDGVIIADTNISPYYARPDLMIRRGITHVPSAAAVRGLKRAVRANIANDDTKAQIQRAFIASGLANVPINPSTFVDPNTGLMATPFMAMLGSKNGAGVAYLLLTHKAAMGFQCINAIRVWAQKDWPMNGAATAENLNELVAYMSFEIVDTPTGT
ncbi:hypothetical protein BCON_0325g00080 [Botryotinia convoluta]|uniref:Uncharacterized protein n=1 Tax=Botryotinia convoluta TaxID=54673 RepID=A0A4Z1HI56_9HELO|nr:hypothetical protein BCON_0325g00080 [Botryotinia convoluta]